MNRGGRIGAAFHALRSRNRDYGPIKLKLTKIFYGEREAGIIFANAKRKDEKKIGPWFIGAASTLLVYQAITELFSKGTNKLFNACQKGSSEGISLLWNDWIGQDSIDTSSRIKHIEAVVDQEFGEVDKIKKEVEKMKEITLETNALVKQLEALLKDRRD